MKTLDELKSMNDDELFKYFSKHAKYSPQSLEKFQYSIRLGSNSLFSGDTAELRDKFFKAVRE